MPLPPVERVQNKKQKIREKIESLQKELIDLNAEEAYATQLTELCPDCKGTGDERYTDAAGSRDWRDCSTCKGWGYISKGLTCAMKDPVVREAMEMVTEVSIALGELGERLEDE